MHSWKSAVVHPLAAMQELYEQMLPTKLYSQGKTMRVNRTK